MNPALGDRQEIAAAPAVRHNGIEKIAENIKKLSSRLGTIVIEIVSPFATLLPPDTRHFNSTSVMPRRRRVGRHDHNPRVARE
jgi:hypothetical protein